MYGRSGKNARKPKVLRGIYKTGMKDFPYWGFSSHFIDNGEEKKVRPRFYDHREGGSEKAKEKCEMALEMYLSCLETGRLDLYFQSFPPRYRRRDNITAKRES